MPFLLRSIYRKPSITDILLMAGLIDAIIGGANDRPDLFTFALLLMGIGLTVRWIRWQRIPDTHRNGSLLK